VQGSFSGTRQQTSGTFSLVNLYTAQVSMGYTDTGLLELVAEVQHRRA